MNSASVALHQHTASASRGGKVISAEKSF